jgi:lysophospholipase L1-like esterase
MGRTMPSEEFDNQTIRMIVHTTIGGHRARVRLSNAFGKEPLVVGAAHIAIRAAAGAIVPASDRTLTFSGKPSITIPPGALVLSDPVDLDVPQLGDLAISIYVPGKPGSPTWHFTGLHTTYLAGPGDFTGKTDIPDASKGPSWYWIQGVDVAAPKGTSAIVAFGDSITDGAQSTVDANRSWPSDLAKRLLARRGRYPQLAVLNAGISGNRILHDVVGPNALARFDRDALLQSGVEDVIVLESINDIGFSSIPNNADQAVSADDLIAGLRQLVERAHVRGIRIFGATLTPYLGATYASPEGEAKREAINKWIRTGGAFDGVIDFDAAVRDPEHPEQVLPAYDSGDHLHPSDAGYQAMADAIDLSLFAPGGKAARKHPVKSGRDASK